MKHIQLSSKYMIDLAVIIAFQYAVITSRCWFELKCQVLKNIGNSHFDLTYYVSSPR